MHGGGGDGGDEGAGVDNAGGEDGGGEGGHISVPAVSLGMTRAARAASHLLTLSCLRGGPIIRLAGPCLA